MSGMFMMSADGESVIALDAVTNISYSKTGIATKFAVQDGSVISDHYHSDKPTISFQGVLSNTKIRGRTPEVGKFVKMVEQLMDKGAYFTVYGTNDGAIPDMDVCVISSFSANRDATTMDSLKASFSIYQIDITKKAKADKIVMPSKKTDGQLADKVKTGTGSKTEAPEHVKYTQLAKQWGGKNLPQPTVGDVLLNR